jgi:hypothetical protein
VWVVNRFQASVRMMNARMKGVSVTAAAAAAAAIAVAQMRAWFRAGSLSLSR